MNGKHRTLQRKYQLADLLLRRVHDNVLVQSRAPRHVRVMQTSGSQPYKQ